MEKQTASTGKLKKFLATYISLIIALAAIGVILLISIIMYRFTENLLKERLQSRLTAITSTAATKFDAEEVEKIKGEESVNLPVFEKIVILLNEVRDANENIKYAYLMRRTDDPNVLEFIADADSLASLEEVDENLNGILDPEEAPPQPGDPYEASEYPVLRDEAFYGPSVDRELQPDQWGLIMAAYAPIFDENGDAVAVLGIDVIVNDFNKVTRAALLPFALFVAFLVLVLALQTRILVHLYQERVDAVKELDRQKDELLSIVSHQLATPTTAIRWQLESMLDGDVGKLTDKQKEHVETTHGVVQKLVDLIGMILDVSRIQLGKMQVTKQELDLDKYFKELMAVIEPKAMEKKVKFIKHFPEKLPIAMLDKRLTNMTLENLLSNAVKYTPAGGEVEFKVELKDSRIYCMVRDTGMGIPEKEQSQIFDKLFRASNVRNTVDGNGLGLSVAKGGVESQGGSIRFESKEGKGTTFYVELPLN